MPIVKLKVLKAVSSKDRFGLTVALTGSPLQITVTSLMSLLAAAAVDQANLCTNAARLNVAYCSCLLVEL